MTRIERTQKEAEMMVPEIQKKHTCKRVTMLNFSVSISEQSTLELDHQKDKPESAGTSAQVRYSYLSVPIL